MPTDDELKSLFLHIWDGIWHRKEASKTISETFADDFAMHFSSLSQPISKDAWIGFVARWQTAFPDGRMDIEDMVVEDDKVWCYWTSTGTHSAEYLGVPATGKTIKYKGLDIYRFWDGKVIESRAIPDALSLLRQLGAFPS